MSYSWTMKHIEPRYRLTRLGETLDAQGRHQRWVAKKVGVSESLLSKARTGERTVDGAIAERIATLLGVPFGMLCDLQEGPNIGPMERAA